MSKKSSAKESSLPKVEKKEEVDLSEEKENADEDAEEEYDDTNSLKGTSSEFKPFDDDCIHRFVKTNETKSLASSNIASVLKEAKDKMLTDLLATYYPDNDLDELTEKFNDVAIEVMNEKRSKKLKDSDNPIRGKCIDKIKKGLRAGEICQRKVTSKDSEGKYCAQHLNSDHSEGDIEQNPNFNKKCEAILSTGPKKGTVCNCRCCPDSDKFCKKHIKSKGGKISDARLQNKCKVVLGAQSRRSGQECGRFVTEKDPTFTFCGTHHKG